MQGHPRFIHHEQHQQPMAQELYTRPATHVTVTVIREMLRYANADVEALVSRCRKRDIMDLRRAVCWSLYRCGYTVVEIATIIRRDHSTVSHHILTTNDIVEVDTLYRLYCEGMLIAAERGLSSHGLERPERMHKRRCN